MEMELPKDVLPQSHILSEAGFWTTPAKAVLLHRMLVLTGEDEGL